MMNGGCNDKNMAVPVFSLPRPVRQFWKQDVNTKWSTNHDYFQGLLACEFLRVLLHRVEHSLAESLYTLDHGDGELFANLEATAVVHGRDLARRLRHLLRQLEKKLATKVAAMTCRPLVEKLLDAMDATPLERRIFRQVFCSSTSLIPTVQVYEGQHMFDTPLYYDDQSGTTLKEVHELFAESQGGEERSIE